MVGNSDNFDSVEMLRPAEVSVLLGVSRNTFYTLVKRDGLPVVRVGTAIRVPIAQLNQWVADRVEVRYER